MFCEAGLTTKSKRKLHDKHIIDILETCSLNLPIGEQWRYIPDISVVKIVKILVGKGIIFSFPHIGSHSIA